MKTADQYPTNEEIHLKARQEITECIAATMKGVYLPSRGDKLDEAADGLSAYHNKKAAVILFRPPLCDSARIQTWNRLIRSQVLYSVELRSHSFAFASANV